MVILKQIERGASPQLVTGTAHKIQCCKILLICICILQFASTWSILRCPSASIYKVSSCISVINISSCISVINILVSFPTIPTGQCNTYRFGGIRLGVSCDPSSNWICPSVPLATHRGQLTASNLTRHEAEVSSTLSRLEEPPMAERNTSSSRVSWRRRPGPPLGWSHGVAEALCRNIMEGTRVSGA